MTSDRSEWLDVEACATRRGIKPGTWRAYVSRGQAPAPDDPDDADGRPKSHRRPLWRPETVDNFAWPGQGRRTPAGRRRRAELDARRAETERAGEADAALEAWLTQHHRALLEAAGALVDQRDALLAVAGDRAGELAAAIDQAGEHMTGRPSRTLAAGVAYALFLSGAPGELATYRRLREGYDQARGRRGQRTEWGNDT